MKMAHGPAAGLELDLLLALEALLAVGSVTRAATRLGLTQSAMSHRLRRLRDALGDPVVVQGRGRLVPTPRALRLGQVVSRSLLELRSALASVEAFDPTTSARVFTVMTSDFAEFEILPRVLEDLSSSAPGVSMVMREFSPDMFDALERGAIDLVVGPQLDGVPGLVQRKVGANFLASALRVDHPIVGKRLDLETYLSLRHVVVDPAGSEAVGAVDGELEKLGRRRDVAMRVPHFLGAPFIAARSDLVLTAPWALLRHFARLLPLALFEPPLELPSTRVFMTWHERVVDDPAHVFLRELTARCTQVVLEAPVKRPRLGQRYDPAQWSAPPPASRGERRRQAKAPSGA
jgi:DNA-binding transcriptional LysR family regulator